MSLQHARITGGPALKASYLMTFRDSDGARSALLRAVVDWLLAVPEFEVIVVEQDTVSRLDARPLPASVKTLFAYNNGPFNKAWGLNVAARQASHDLLVIGDADMVMPGDALQRSVSACAERFDAVNPYAHLCDLSEIETRKYLAGELELADIEAAERVDRTPAGEFLCFCGGICVFRRDVYFALGGMDENFLGWGGEDDAMSINLQRYTKRLAVQQGSTAYHLWHPRSPRRYQHPHYRRNLVLLEQYRTCTDPALEKLRATQRASMGDAERYAVRAGQ